MPVPTPKRVLRLFSKKERRSSKAVWKIKPAGFWLLAACYKDIGHGNYFGVSVPKSLPIVNIPCIGSTDYAKQILSADFADYTDFKKIKHYK
jgi:hypothetical protein